MKAKKIVILKNIVLLISLSLMILGCNSQKPPKNKRVGIARETMNPSTPFIYKNGYANYSIEKIPWRQNNDTVYLNSLKFNAVFTAFYTKKIMYDKFGMWSKEIRPNNEAHPILLWENVQLFKNDNNLFSVYAKGDEKWDEIYASVLVFDAEQNDCLGDDSTLKNKIISYFAKAIRTVEDKSDFYEVYWKSVNEFKKM